MTVFPGEQWRFLTGWQRLSSVHVTGRSQRHRGFPTGRSAGDVTGQADTQSWRYSGLWREAGVTSRATEPGSYWLKSSKTCVIE
ncbi:hypothetical protein RRG08_067165 [Elysia crispata]|uniref:Uncharacterized protein n=1 Tax=Elysia crispata TaxID=231223 RepID=A0AAE1DAT7_9GAST|nr:hypothetical protein RRG08_067165 [Elysia crispata]